MLRLFILIGLLLSILMGGYAPANAASRSLESSLMAQAVDLEEVSAAEVENFASAYRTVFQIQQDAEAAMAAAVEAQGLTLERFGEIADSRQEGSTVDVSTISETETASFSAAVDQIMTIRQQAEVDMQTAIEAEGLSVEDFNQILSEAEQNPNLRQRIADQFEPEGN